MKPIFRFAVRLRTWFIIIIIITLSQSLLFSQQAETETGKTDFKPFIMGGFNILVHNGIYGSTVPARPDGGSYNPNGGDSYSGVGFGVNFTYRIMDIFSLYFDINNYRSSTPVAYSGGYATSDWVWEMNDYSQRLVGPFEQDANYSITTTGIRLGLKVYPLKKSNLQPWYGIYYGYYDWNLGVFSGDKKLTYGNTDGNTTGLTFLNFGIDYTDKSGTIGATLFVELGSPVARNYSIENCLVTGWTLNDYGEGTHLFGYNRIGLSLNFFSAKK